MLNILIILHDRVCFNYRVAGSASNPELGAKTVSSYTQADGSVATGADKLDLSAFSSFFTSLC